MAKAAVLDLKGKQVGDLPLADEIFAQVNDANIGTMHAAVVRQLGNARSGSANSKTRSEVRGGGAKPWRQKGTGRARAGSRRSPLWAGGGVIFGPKPRDYSISMPRKMRHNAIKSALAAKVNNLVVVNSFAPLKEIKTKVAGELLKTLQLNNKKVLVVIEGNVEESKRFGLSVRNIENVVVVHANNLGVKELLDCEAILTTQGAMEFITKWLVPSEESKAPGRKKVYSSNGKSQAAHVATREEKKSKAKSEIKPEAKSEAKAVNKTAKEAVKAQTKEVAQSKQDISPLQAIANTSSKNKAAGEKEKSAESTTKSKKDTDAGSAKGKGKSK